MSITVRKSTVASRGGAALLMGLVLLLAVAANAQYTKTNLTGDMSGEGNFTDPNLVNAWGIVANPTASIAPSYWVADNGTGLATMYSATGRPGAQVLTIPTANGSGRGSPTGLVSNTSTDFKISEGSSTAPATLLFDTLDGTISGWNPSVDRSHAIIAVNNSSHGSVYTGLAIALTSSGNFIYAANSSNNAVEIYDGTFNLVRSFTDNTLPMGFTPYGVQVIGNTLYVTFAKFGSGSGYVDTYDLSGGSQRQLVAGGFLDEPWSVALAPASFGPLSGDLLIGNLGSGWINAYNPSTGAFVNYVNSTPGMQITINGLWGLLFTNAPTSIATPPKLFFTSGPGGYAHGIFGVITVNH
jgi:uncharacterized protein (TIGR03118 family)